MMVFLGERVVQWYFWKVALVDSIFGIRVLIN